MTQITMTMTTTTTPLPTTDYDTNHDNTATNHDDIDDATSSSKRNNVLSDFQLINSGCAKKRSTLVVAATRRAANGIEC